MTRTWLVLCVWGCNTLNKKPYCSHLLFRHLVYIQDTTKMNLDMKSLDPCCVMKIRCNNWCNLQGTRQFICSHSLLLRLQGCEKVSFMNVLLWNNNPWGVEENEFTSQPSQPFWSLHILVLATNYYLGSWF